jgi:hypothetical protein
VEKISMTYTLTLDHQSVAIIGQALGKQPFELVAPVVANIQAQINAQETAAKEPKPEAAEPEKPQAEVTEKPTA